MKTIAIVMGVSGSGKTTVAVMLADALGVAFLEGDKLHPRGNVEKMRSGTPLTDEDRWPWLRAIAARIDQWRADGKAGVVTCSALKRAYRDVLVHGRDDVRIVYLDGSQELIARRLKARKGHFMPPALLDSQFNALQPPGDDEHPVTVSIDAPVEAIVDDIMRKLGPDLDGKAP